jgi:hypothetical protein
MPDITVTLDLRNLRHGKYYLATAHDGDQTSCNFPLNLFAVAQARSEEFAKVNAITAPHRVTWDFSCGFAAVFSEEP